MRPTERIHLTSYILHLTSIINRRSSVVGRPKQDGIAIEIGQGAWAQRGLVPAACLLERRGGAPRCTRESVRTLRGPGNRSPSPSILMNAGGNPTTHRALPQPQSVGQYCHELTRGRALHPFARGERTRSAWRGQCPPPPPPHIRAPPSNIQLQGDEDLGRWAEPLRD
jgi:hypothetical protein